MKKKIKIIKEGSSKMWWNKHMNEIYEVEKENYYHVRVMFMNENRIMSIGKKCVEFIEGEPDEFLEPPKKIE